MQLALKDIPRRCGTMIKKYVRSQEWECDQCERHVQAPNMNHIGAVPCPGKVSFEDAYPGLVEKENEAEQLFEVEKNAKEKELEVKCKKEQEEAKQKYQERPDYIVTKSSYLKYEMEELKCFYEEDLDHIKSEFNIGETEMWQKRAKEREDYKKIEQ